MLHIGVGVGVGFPPDRGGPGPWAGNPVDTPLTSVGITLPAWAQLQTVDDPTTSVGISLPALAQLQTVDTPTTSVGITVLGA